jgi:DNA-binding PadR family transcriptional regulator
MSAPRRSVLALAVLSMLTEAPSHAYRMQQLIKERHKDDVVNVSQRNSIYQTLERLLREGLIEVEATHRGDNRPDRTVYRITPDGREILQTWLRDMLAVPAREYPQFPAALSFLPNLSPADAIEALTDRVGDLERQLAAVVADLERGGTFLPRLFLVESEYQQRVLEAELTYVRALVEDLRAERITWSFAGNTPL